jgi:hypothetical protein
VTIDFTTIKSAALSRARTLLPNWLPGGKFANNEYIARNPKRNDAKPGSFNININTGKWADFAIDQKGGDLISLYAYLNDLKQGEAARRLADELGIAIMTSTGNGSGRSHSETVVVPLKGNVPPAVADGQPRQIKAPLKLAEFAERKKLPVEFLNGQGVHQDRGTLIFRYRDMSGQRAKRQRFRTGEHGFGWVPGPGRPILYGAWQLHDWRKRDVSDLYLVEGESDSLTLWHHGYAALGIPGCSNCELLAIAHVRDWKRVFIVREDDEGGVTFEKGMTARLAKLEHRGEVRVIEMEKLEVNDVSDLHVKLHPDAQAFRSQLAMLVKALRLITLPIAGLEAAWSCPVSVDGVGLGL